MRPVIIGPLGPAELACLRSWSAHGWHPLFIHMGERRVPSLLNRLATGYLHVPDHTENGERIALIRDFLDAHGATGLTCVSYNLMHWLHQHAAELPQNVSLWIATPEMLTILHSKCLQADAARGVGLRVLPSISVGSDVPADIAPEYFPLVLRPDEEAKVRPLFKMTLVKNQRDLASFLTSRTFIGCALLGQRFINGPNLVMHGIRTSRGEHRHQAAFMARRKFGGVSLTIEPAALSDELADKCRAFIDRIGYVGSYHLEFLFDPESDDHYFLEINGRLGGTTGKVLACGYDEPAYLPQAFQAAATSRHIYTAMRKKRIYTSKRGVARAVLESIRGRGTIFDYPYNGSRRASLALAWGMLSWRDEMFRHGHYQSALAYTIHSLIPKQRARRAQASATHPEALNHGETKIPVAKDRGNILQRLVRIAAGPYQVFHILTFIGDAEQPHQNNETSLSLEHDVSCDRPRFSLLDTENGNVKACSCSFWPSTTSNQIRSFIPLKPGEAELVYLETRDDYRHRGLAKRLVASASGIMLQNGFSRLYARVWHSNKASLRTFSSARWHYAYTMIEVYPLGKKMRFRMKLPRRFVFH